MNERDIFLAAFEITDPIARSHYLDDACGGNIALRASVEALFASHEGAGDFLKQPLIHPAGSDSSGNAAIEKPSAAMEQTVHSSPEQHALNSEDDDTTEDDEIPLGFLSPSTKPDSLGRLGHYEVLEVLGKGAFGTVLRAFDEKLHRMVAIKVMSAELASTSPARKRFLREARSAAAIRHENVVAIHAVEEVPIPYLVMECIPGKTLQHFLKGHGPLDVTNTLSLSGQMARGLAAAHSQGLIHRDIKPANILLEEGVQSKVKITDFGLARAADDASLTQSGTIAGTPMYMSPEQAHSNQVDQRSDLFSLGSVLYEMVSGRPPFRASSTLAVLKRVTEDTPRPIQEIIPEVPDWLCTIISKLQAKQPADRYQTANEVAELLARCQSELQHAGKVTCVQSSPQSSPHALREESRAAKDVDPPHDIPRPTTSTARSANFTQSVKATLNRPRLIAASIIGTAAIIAILMFNRFNNSTDPASNGRQPSEPIAEVSNLKSPISNPDTGWLGWPADAPPPAIAPFDAEQAKQHQEAWAKYLSVPVEYTNSIGMKLRLIPPSEFMMGSTPLEIAEAVKTIDPTDPAKEHWQDCIQSEGPQHRVILTRPIYIGVNEVTQAEYEVVIGINPSRFSPTGEGIEAVAGMETSRHPVEMLNWNDAADFCAKMSEREKLRPLYIRNGDTIQKQDGIGYRLPTEAEWECGCRAGTTTKYWVSDIDEDLLRVGWFGTNSNARTHAVSELEANPYGLCDMHGNVWEWVNDWWESNYYAQFGGKSALNPKGSLLDVSRRVLRGGGWDFAASRCRAAGRPLHVPLYRDSVIGFRVSLPVDAVRQSLKLTGPAIPKAQSTELSSNSTDQESGGRQPSGTPSEISNSKSQISNAESEISNFKSQISNDPSTDPDRRAAEWVQSIGGTVKISENGQERWAGDVGNLPQGVFELTAVNLNGNYQKLSDTGLAHFQDCKNLMSLTLYHFQVSDAELANFKNCEKLTHIELVNSQVSDAGLAHFKNCKNLTQLNLHGSPVTDAGLAYFKNCKNLTQLNLQGSPVTDAGLANFKDYKNLTDLNLNDTKVSDVGLAHFKDCKNLTSLHLQSTQVTDAGLVHFKDCKNLTDLVLNATQVSDVGLAYFKDCSNLTHLNLAQGKVSDAGLVLRQTLIFG